MKEKSLPLAIGLNIFLPGAGYIYMGKWFVGIFACLLIIGMYLSVSLGAVGFIWFSMNILMVIDMIILSNKRKKDVAEANTKKCPVCAETIQREAKICRFCKADVQ